MNLVTSVLNSQSEEVSSAPPGDTAITTPATTNTEDVKRKRAILEEKAQVSMPTRLSSKIYHLFCVVSCIGTILVIFHEQS